MKKYLMMVVTLLVSLTGWAESETRLVVGITINQFYPEWLSIYKNDLGEEGFKRIMKEGQSTMADYNYLFSQTGMDQATIYTGLLPASHGIVAHDWLDRLSGVRVNNTESEEYLEIGEGDSLKGYSPEHLQALSLGCMMKMNNLFSKVYSVGMNPEEVVLSGGSCADLALWFNEKSGKWVSSRYYADSLPGWVKDFNNASESDFFVKRGWMPLAEEEGNSLLLKLKNKVGIGNSFYYDIAQFKRKFNTYRVLKATPYANSMITNLAVALIEEVGLGKDDDADMETIILRAILQKTVTKTEEMEKVEYTLLENDGLAFDHAKIIVCAIERLRGKVEYTGLALHLMPEEFTLTQLQQAYEVILGKTLLKPAFRRKIAGLVEETNHYTENEGHRPSRLFRRKWEE